MPSRELIVLSLFGGSTGFSIIWRSFALPSPDRKDANTSFQGADIGRGAFKERMITLGASARSGSAEDCLKRKRMGFCCQSASPPAHVQQVLPIREGVLCLN